MVVDAYASFPHYFAHIAPIWRELPDDLRGTFYISRYIANDPLVQTFNCRPIASQRLSRQSNPIIVSAYSDYRVTGRAPVIFVEHGAGQTYVNQPGNSSYSGGRHRDRAILFICPNDRVALNNQTRYPHIPTAVVGCPRLDDHHLSPLRLRKSPPTIAFTFHAHYGISPETRSTFNHFRSAVLAVRSLGYPVLGHAHPRAYPKISAFYSQHEIPHTADPDEVLSTADCLVVDNSSFGFEAASIGIRIVWLSPPFYRRDVTQWPRFWDALVLGEEATTASEVPEAITRALRPVDGDLLQLRDNFLSSVYKHRKGDSASRAAEAIVGVLEKRH